MAFTLPEPPEWWAKHKPLRWVLALVVLFWLGSTLWPMLKPEPAPESATDSTPVTVAQDAPETTEVPAPPAKPVETPKPAPVAPPKPAPVVVVPPKPVPKPEPVPEPVPAPEPAPKPAAEPPPAPKPDLMAPYSRVEAERVTLMNGLRSYDSVEAIQAVLEKGRYSADASTINQNRPNENYPPYRNDTLVISNYKHGNFEGKLTLEFFNDRLYQTYFEPTEAADYLRWLRSQGFKLPVKRTGRSILTQGHLQVTTNIDFASSDVGKVMRSTPFVFWEDTRLTKQMSDWGPVS